MINLRLEIFFPLKEGGQTNSVPFEDKKFEIRNFYMFDIFDQKAEIDWSTLESYSIKKGVKLSLYDVFWIREKKYQGLRICDL